MPDPARNRRQPGDGDDTITPGTPGQINPVTLPDRTDDDLDRPAPPARHCWVRIGEQRQPGLVLDWRRRSDGAWEGFVAIQTPDGHTASWFRADRLEPT